MTRKPHGPIRKTSLSLLSISQVRQSVLFVLFSKLYLGINSEVVRGEFAVDEGVDDSLGERFYFFIDETIVYMLVAADAKIVSVVRTSRITRGESVHVGKILGDRGISLR